MNGKIGKLLWDDCDECQYNEMGCAYDEMDDLNELLYIGDNEEIYCTFFERKENEESKPHFGEEH